VNLSRVIGQERWARVRASFECLRCVVERCSTRRGTFMDAQELHGCIKARQRYDIVVTVVSALGKLILYALMHRQPVWILDGPLWLDLATYERLQPTRVGPEGCDRHSSTGTHADNVDVSKIIPGLTAVFRGNHGVSAWLRNVHQE